MTIRFDVKPRDVPPEKAARRLGIGVEEFNAILPNLISRGFPTPDQDTGNFDLHAIDKWMDVRHCHLFNGTPAMTARDARDVVAGRIAAMRKGAAA